MKFDKSKPKIQGTILFSGTPHSGAKPSARPAVTDVLAAKTSHLRVSAAPDNRKYSALSTQAEFKF
jgi:hypothetical protein